MALLLTKQWHTVANVAALHDHSDQVPATLFYLSHFHALAGHAAIDPPQQAAKHAAGADFVKLIETLFNQISHRVFPTHRLEDLPHQEAADFLGIVVRQGVDVGNHGDPRLVHGHVRQGLGQALVGRPHDFGVERPGHGQRHGLHRPERLGHLGRPLAGAVSARNDDVARAKQVGDFEDFAVAGLFAKGLDLDPFQPEDAHHAAGRGVGGLLHGRAAPLHQHQPVLELHHAGEDHGRVFAQAQPGGRLAGQDHVGRFGPQRFQRRQAGDEDRRLAVDGGIELVGRPLESRASPDRSRAPRRRDRTAGGRRAATRPAACPCPPSAPLVREIETRFCSRCLDDFPAHVVTTVRADHVRRHRRAALLAIGKLLGLLGIVRPATAGAGVALSAFWNGHRIIISKFGTFVI